MLLRCARGMMAGPVGMAAGLVFVTGVAAGVAAGAGLAGAALVGRRLWEERKGWRGGASAADDLPPADPIADAPDA
jgi:hypothetical protein